MGRLSFETEGEPGSLMPVLEVFSDAVARDNAVEWVVPGDVQTEAYSYAVLARWSPADLAAKRATNRVNRGRTLNEAGVRSRVFMKSRALGNLAAVGGDVAVLYAQLEHLVGLIDADTQAGDASILKIGIVPAGIALRRDPGGPATSNISLRDVGIAETPKRTFVLGADGYEVDPAETKGIRSSIVAMRRVIVDEWAQDAVFGAEARDMVLQTQDLLEQAA